MLVQKLKAITEAVWFHVFITAVILAAGLLVGIETYSDFAAQHEPLIHFLDNLILTIFVIEIGIKVGAEGRKPFRYFLDPWNIFDFTIVAICLLPASGSFVAVFRLARILRVLRLVTALPRLQLLVGALLHSIPSIMYIMVLLMLHFYIYSVMGSFLFGANDPTHFGNLHISFISLFRVVTLEDWTDILYTQMYGSDVYYTDQFSSLSPDPSAQPVVAAIYFISFIMLGSMIILNLFIGVIMNGMNEVQQEQDKLEMMKAKKETDIVTLPFELEQLFEDINDLKERIELIQSLASYEKNTSLIKNGNKGRKRIAKHWRKPI